MREGFNQRSLTGVPEPKWIQPTRQLPGSRHLSPSVLAQCDEPAHAIKHAELERNTEDAELSIGDAELDQGIAAVEPEPIFFFFSNFIFI